MSKTRWFSFVVVGWLILSVSLQLSGQDSRSIPNGFPLPTLEKITPDNANRVVLLGTLDGFTDWATGTTFSPDGSIVAATGFYQGLRLWDVQTGKLLGAVSCADRMTDAVTGYFLGRSEYPAFSPDGSIIAVACDLNIHIWQIAALLRGGNIQPSRVLKGAESFKNEVTFSHDARYVAATDNLKQIIEIWEIETGALIAEIEEHDLCCPDFHPEKSILAYLDGDKTHFVSIETMEEITVSPIQAEVFNADWSLAADIDIGDYGGFSRKTIIRLWDVGKARQITTLINQDNHTPDVLTFNPDSSLLASGSIWFHILLWDTSTYQRLVVLPTGGVSSLAFNPEGTLLVSTHAGSGITEFVNLWGVPAED